MVFPGYFFVKVISVVSIVVQFLGLVCRYLVEKKEITYSDIMDMMW